MATPRTEATLQDKLLLIPHAARVLAAVFYRIATYGFSSTKAKRPFKDFVFAALRANLGAINVAQEQWTIATSTEAAYLDIAGKQKFQPETTVLNSGLRLHWLGPKTAEKVLVYFHGGGYVLPCSGGHVQWLFDLQQELSKKSNISVILVGYTLAPHATYPTQLSQAAETLAYLLDVKEKRPGDIIIGGDSAGGNMTLALISHILHPNPKVQKINLNEPLATAVLISPWVKFGSDDPSFTTNRTSDMIDPAAVARWSSLFLGGTQSNEYTEPIFADDKWFSGLDKVVKDVLVWGGGGECLIDSIRAIVPKLKSGNSKTELVVQPGAAHEDFILDVILEYKGKAEGTKVIESWLAERV